MVAYSFHLPKCSMSVYPSFQSKGVRLVVVAIGPGTKKKKYQKVLNDIGGEDVFYDKDYEALQDAVSDVISMICRKYGTEISVKWNGDLKVKSK